MVRKIIYENEYNIYTLNNEIRRQMKKRVEGKYSKPRTKWAKFTYIGQQTRFFTKLLKNSVLKITYKSDNKIERLLSAKNENVTDKFNKVVFIN
jgi:hypothetical protein